jgi:hypothetical protein
VISEPSHAVPRYLSDLFQDGTLAALSDAELLKRFASRRSEHDEAAERALTALLARHAPFPRHTNEPARRIRSQCHDGHGLHRSPVRRYAPGIADTASGFRDRESGSSGTDQASRSLESAPRKAMDTAVGNNVDPTQPLIARWSCSLPESQRRFDRETLPETAARRQKPTTQHADRTEHGACQERLGRAWPSRSHWQVPTSITTQSAQTTEPTAHRAGDSAARHARPDPPDGRGSPPRRRGSAHQSHGTHNYTRLPSTDRNPPG